MKELFERLLIIVKRYTEHAWTSEKKELQLLIEKINNVIEIFENEYEYLDEKLANIQLLADPDYTDYKNIKNCQYNLNQIFDEIKDIRKNHKETINEINTK